MRKSLKERLDDRKRRLLEQRKEYTKRYYQDLTESRVKKIPLAHVGAVAPTELLYSMGFKMCMPENYVTICCARQMAEPFCEVAEQKGFSGDCQ